MTLTIKNKLLLIIALVLFGNIALFVHHMNNEKTLAELVAISSNLKKTNVSMLQLRRAEKDFLLRKDVKYKKPFAETIIEVQSLITSLEIELTDIDILHGEIPFMRGNINNYQDAFNELVQSSVAKGLDKESGKYGNLRRASHELEAIIIENGNLQAHVYLLTMRRHEKDFILRSDEKYEVKLIDSALQLDELLVTTRNKNLLATYVSEFQVLVKISKKIGLKFNTGIKGKMRNIIHVVEDSLKKEIQRIDQKINDHRRFNQLLSLGITIVLSALVFIAVILIANQIITPIQNFKRRITDIRKNNDLSKIAEIANDEIGDLSKEFNALIKNLRLITASKDEEITHRKETERALNKSIIKANIAVESKGAFLANMSHEIRTPMNGVLGMLGLMLTGNLDREQEHRVNIAKSSADSLLTLINDILDFSKVDAGKLSVEPIEFDVRTLMENFSESMALEVQEKNIELILDLTQLNHSMIKSDPSRLRQILSNIVGNAIKFTEAGEIVICVELVESTNGKGEPRTELHCKIKDTGIGIKKEQQALLFDVFSQVDASTTRKYGGTGLGLGISQKLCQLMDGGIKVMSEEGKGSCFEFNIHIEKCDEVAPPSSDVDVSQVYILIVDGNATNRDMLQRQLTRYGAIAVEAESAETALQLCNERLNNLVLPNNQALPIFDMVIVDMDISNMNGEKLAKSIRANEKFNEMKLVVMTPMAAIIDAKILAEIGVCAYFLKPITTPDLFNALAICTDDHTGSDQQTDSDLHAENDPALTEINESEIEWPEGTRVLLVEDNRVNQMVALNVLKI
jgi:signal transduction histidine kinase/CheY-like chemotaxis protein